MALKLVYMKKGLSCQEKRKFLDNWEVEKRDPGAQKDRRGTEPT